MKAGTWLTWILAVFMVGNMAVSGLALIRYDQRCQGVEAESSWQAYMDEHYGDDVIQRVYPNAIRV